MTLWTAVATGGRLAPRRYHDHKGDQGHDVEGVTVQSVFNTIGAILGCRPLPKNISFPEFFSTGQKANRSFKPAKTANRVGFVLNWAQPSNRFRISGLTAVGKNGKKLATLSGKGKPGKLRIKRRSSETFTSLKVRKPKGTRRFKIQVNAKKLSSSDRPLLQASNIGG